MGDPVPSPARSRPLGSLFLSVVGRDSALSRPQLALLQLLLTRVGEPWRYRGILDLLARQTARNTLKSWSGLAPSLIPQTPTP
jgi:hypothetical protein